jgi:hypothetical protein
MKKALRLFAFLAVSIAGLHAQTNTAPAGAHLVAPGDLPPGIKLMPTVTFTYLADTTGIFTMVPQSSILHFDPDGTFTKTPADADPKNFRRFGPFCSSHTSGVATVKGKPDPSDPQQLIIYDGDVDSLPKDIKVVIAVNDKNVPITVFERLPGEPLAVPKK